MQARLTAVVGADLATHCVLLHSCCACSQKVNEGTVACTCGPRHAGQHERQQVHHLLLEAGRLRKFPETLEG